MTNELVLPSSIRPDTWNADTAAMMEFAGLTWLEQRPDPENPGTPKTVRMYAPSGIMAAFIAACRRTGLDPTAKQIYAAQMGGKWTVLIGIDGMRLVAQRSGEYDGQDPIEWQATEDGPWTTVPPKQPFSARIRIYRKGISRPLEQTVTWAEFGGTKGNWDKRPSHMLGIRVESHGFRRLYPMELSGLYTPEDFEADGELVATATPDAPAYSEDWFALFAAASNREELEAVRLRIPEEEKNDKLRTAYLARAGYLSREEARTEDAEVVDPDDTVDDSEPVAAEPAAREMTAEEYEAAEAARFDAEQGATRG
ncbi:recombinase RecT [uncultured Microbacterium sp.]|uniref:recombinase RecT n=1 Tax=uncultured Microbacterium sp. TaxID=191216 RepID=UPI0025CE31EB|nr:recombinase RecT [uncultured Microbacterium sp.]